MRSAAAIAIPAQIQTSLLVEEVVAGWVVVVVGCVVVEVGGTVVVVVDVVVELDDVVDELLVEEVGGTDAVVAVCM